MTESTVLAFLLSWAKDLREMGLGRVGKSKIQHRNQSNLPNFASKEGTEGGFRAFVTSMLVQSTHLQSIESFRG